jgi:hypothetical protein
MQRLALATTLLLLGLSIALADTVQVTGQPS